MRKLIPLGIGLGALAALSIKRGESTMPFPSPRAIDWEGWNWPVPIWNGREPQISDAFQRIQTEAHRSHPGVDILFRKKAGDPGFPYSTPTSFTSQGEGTPIIAAGPGKIWDAGPGRAWQLSIDHGVVSRHVGGVVTWYQHLKGFSRAWKTGDVVKAGTILGYMGGDVPPHYALYHLHFELWFPRRGFPPQAWKADPQPYMKFWKKIPITDEGILDGVRI